MPVKKRKGDAEFFHVTRVKSELACFHKAGERATCLSTYHIGFATDQAGVGEARRQRITRVYLDTSWSASFRHFPSRALEVCLLNDSIVQRIAGGGICR